MNKILIAFGVLVVILLLLGGIIWALWFLNQPLPSLSVVATASATSTPTSTLDIGATVAAAIGTALADMPICPSLVPTATATAMATATCPVYPTCEPTSTLTLTPTPTRTRSPWRPTATSTPTATAQPTAPVILTNTPVPTATLTAVPPTATPIPPTVTPWPTWTPVPITLDLAVAPNPSVGQAPLTTVVTLTVGGSASGQIHYWLDCTNDGSWEYDFQSNSLMEVVSCTYASAGNYTVKAQVSRGGLTVMGNATVIAQ